MGMDHGRHDVGGDQEDRSQEAPCLPGQGHNGPDCTTRGLSRHPLRVEAGAVQGPGVPFRTVPDAQRWG
jgi:hypothetical protein